MNVPELTALLEEACSVLEPYISRSEHGALVFDGQNYASPKAQKFNFDPYALAWWSMLTNTIALIRDAEDLSESQRSYLTNQLCGGMGSFNDFSLRIGNRNDETAIADENLDQIRTKIFHTLTQ